MSTTSITTPERVIKRFFDRVEIEGDCIVSTYSTGSHGYSQIGWVEDSVRKLKLGHRLAWESFNGPIPDGMTVDHICRNRRCVKIEHLRLLTNIQNATLNGNKAKSHCPEGHPYDKDNTYLVASTKHRQCKICRNTRNKNRYRTP